MDFTFGYNACIIIAETNISPCLCHEEHLEPCYEIGIGEYFSDICPIYHQLCRGLF
jgi:hypothetical protein